MLKQVRLGQLEAAVMDVLWENPGGVSARQVRAALPGQQRAVTTVLTVLERLRAKDLVAKDRQGRAAYAWAATKTREQFLSGLMAAALNGSADRAAVLSQFVGTIAEQDLASLQGLLGRRRRPDAGA